MFVSPFYYWFSLKAMWLLRGPRTKPLSKFIGRRQLVWVVRVSSKMHFALKSSQCRTYISSGPTSYFWEQHCNILVTLDTRTGHFIVSLYNGITNYTYNYHWSSRGVCFFVALTLLSSDKSLVTNFLETEEKSVKKVAASFEAKVLKNKVTVNEKKNQQDT